MEMKDMADLLEKNKQKPGKNLKGANDARLAEIEKKGHASDDSLAKIANHQYGHRPSWKNGAGNPACRPAYRRREQGRRKPEHKQAFEKFLRTGQDRELKSIRRKAMNSTSDVDGGVLILPEIQREIDRIAMVNSALYRIARVVNTSARNYNKRVKTAGMACAWPGEGGTAGETTEPKYANIEVVAYPAEVEPWVFNETLEDADVDLAGDLAQEAGIAFC